MVSVMNNLADLIRIYCCKKAIYYATCNSFVLICITMLFYCWQIFIFFLKNDVVCKYYMYRAGFWLTLAQRVD